MRRVLINGSLVIGSGLFFLVVGEIFCRLFFPDPVLRYQNDPELLARFEPNQEGILYLGNGSPSPTMRINELGLRGPNLGATSPRRILFLGDSFTFASGVEEDESFAGLVYDALGGEISVINGGQPGYGVYQIEALFRRLAPELRPELVVLVIWEGLLLRQPLSESKHQNFLRRSARLKQLKSASVLGTHIYRRYERLAMRFGARRFVVSLGETRRSGVSLQEQYRRALKADMERFLRIRSTAQLHGGRLVLVFWPREGFVGKDTIGVSPELTAELRKFSLEHELPFYSVEEALVPYPSEVLLIPNDWHPTPLAHCLVGKKMVSELRQLGYRGQMEFECAETRVVHK